MGKLDQTASPRSLNHVERACATCGKHYFIPCLTQGLNIRSFPGVYEAASKAIDEMSKKMF